MLSETFVVEIFGGSTYPSKTSCTHIIESDHSEDWKCVRLHPGGSEPQVSRDAFQGTCLLVTPTNHPYKTHPHTPTRCAYHSPADRVAVHRCHHSRHSCRHFQKDMFSHRLRICKWCVVFCSAAPQLETNWITQDSATVSVPRPHLNLIG